MNNGPGNEDGFLNKWDANGNQIWANFVAGLASDANHDVALDSDGNVYVAGAFSDTVEFDPGNPAGNLTSAGLTDIFIVKYDGNGNFLWVKGVGGTSSDGGYGITVDGSGNVYLTGIYVGTVDFDPGSGVSNLTSAGFADVFVLELDGGGNFVWAKSIGGTSGENGFDIAVDASGHIFTTGYFNETADFDPGAGTSSLTSAGQSDIFISKLDNSGDFLWARQVGGTDFDRGFEVRLDGSGNVYLAGHRSYDILISKLDQDGQILWQNIMGGIGADAANGIALDATGNLYVTGEFGGTVDFDPGPGTSNLSSAGGNDVFISKLDIDGNFLWAKNLGGTSMDLGESIVVRNDGSLYLAGAFSDTVDFDLGAATHTLTSGGNLDVFISKQNLIPQIYYVKWNASGANNGSSWTDAYTDLQSAFAVASSGDEIWVAAGTYEPTTGTDRTVSFTLKNGVAIYGGFAGNETARDQRNPAAHVTILSGDIDNNDSQTPIINNLMTVTGNNTNSYHVVTGATGATIDGFVITAGYANGSFPNNGGGGMYNSGASPVVVNTAFTGNFATGLGGGMFNDNSSSPNLMNITFNNNFADLGGGMLNQFDSSPTVVNATFSNNSATNGGALLNRAVNSNPTLTHVTMSGNSATIDGGAIANAGDSLVIRNSILWGNNGGEIFNILVTPVVKNSVVQGGYPGVGNINEDPLLGPLQSNGGFTQTMALGADSPAIDAGDDAACPDIDQRGIERPQGGHCDIGAYEYQDLSPAVPGVARLRSPSGNIETNRPTYSWNQVSNATWYYLWVNGPSGNIFKQWYTSAQANCNGTTCSVSPAGLTLKRSNYTWWVQTWNEAGLGPWSEGMSFTPTPPGKASLTSPNTTITDRTPLYTWEEVSDSSWYYLWVNGPKGTVIKKWYEAADVCSSGTCSVEDPTSLTGGAHTWWIQTWNEAGVGQWSDGMNFTIPMPDLPGIATLTSPHDKIGTKTPTYTWSEVNGATWYYLWVNGPKGNVIKQWYNATDLCSSGTCSIQNPTALGSGVYTWWIQTWNEAGVGSWSEGMSFTLAVPAKAILTSPDGSIDTNNPTYTWEDVPGSTWYYLWVNGPSGVVLKQWYASAEANCDGTTCSVTPSTTLSNGAHTWWIQTWNEAGVGPWSVGINFQTP